MIVDSAGHALYVLRDAFGQVGVSGGSDAIGLAGQQCKRSLEVVRQVARSRHSALHNLLAALQ
jgi:hypothetical protein